MTINNVSGVRSDINEILSKIREVSNRSSALSENQATASAHPFNQVMSLVDTSLSKVNNIQSESEGLKNSFLLGDKNVSMSQVIVASQKSKLAFEGLMAVRNKILEAYKEIMNMPV
jgi:flagellar hook-basal body complex protein FliE